MKVTNIFSSAIVLEGGTILAAAGTKGSTKEVASISDRDRRRYITPGHVVIAAEPEPAPVKMPVVSSAPPIVAETASGTAPVSETVEKEQARAPALPGRRQPTRPDAAEEK